MSGDLVTRLHDPIFYALPVVAIIIVVECIAIRLDRQDLQRYDLRDTRTSVLTGVGALLISTALRGLSLGIFAWIYVYLAPFRLPNGAWYTWVAVFFLVDLNIYVYHRMSHRMRFLWAGHIVHHSSPYVNVAIAVRRKWAQWFEMVLWVPLVLLGIPPVLVFTMQTIQLAYGLFAHTEKIGKLPRPFETILVTPSNHRVHHGKNPEYIDKNYGSILILWDKLFGTYQSETCRPTYGVTKDINWHSVWHVQLDEFIALFRDLHAAKSWRERGGYIFGPPGWEPEKSRPKVGSAAI